MDCCKALFWRFGIPIPNKVTKTQEVYFTWAKPAIQELAIQTINIIRFHKDAEELFKYMEATEVSRHLDENAVRRVHELVGSYPRTFGLDDNNIPIKRNHFSTPLKAYEKSSLNFIFLKDMEEFYHTCTPVKTTRKDTKYGFKSNTPEFRKEISKPKIMLAY